MSYRWLARFTHTLRYVAKEPIQNRYQTLVERFELLNVGRRVGSELGVVGAHTVPL